MVYCGASYEFIKRKGGLVMHIYCVYTIIHILYWLLVVILENCFSFCWMGVSDWNYRIVTTRSAQNICPHFFWRQNSIVAFSSNGTKSLNFNVWCSPVTFLIINFWYLPNYWGCNHLSDLYFVFSILCNVTLSHNSELHVVALIQVP